YNFHTASYNIPFVSRKPFVVERQRPRGSGKFVLVTWFIKLSLNDLQCLERDAMCTVTLGYVVEVARIYPVSLRSQIGSTDQFSIWSILQNFWGENRVARWLEALGGTTERLTNLICFAPTVHKCHQKALFALQPITLSSDKRLLTTKFWWFPSFKPCQAPMIEEGLSHHTSRDNKIQKFFDNMSCQVICSGDEILLRTNDPERLPLPSFELLQMQYVLQCVAALRGAGERDESEYGDDDDDDVDGLRMVESDEVSTEFDIGDISWSSVAASRSHPTSSTVPSSPPIKRHTAWRDESGSTDVKRFFSSRHFAIAGASNDHYEFGYQLLTWYHQHSLPVTPINPRVASIALPSTEYRTVSSPSTLGEPLQTSLSLATPPPVSLQVLQDANAAGIPAVWLQPGTFDDAVLEYARQNFAVTIAGQGGHSDDGWCVLVDGEWGLGAAGRTWAAQKL
ncbi:hypothetical protein Egran_03894, partial [Elaphomyces granulatus]